MRFVKSKRNIQNTSKTLDLVYIAIAAAIIAVCSWISIPTLIPFTMQTFAVFFVLSFLGGKRGTAAILVYLLLGLIGIPVFSNFTGGIGVLLGPTGGYIVGFVLIGLIYWLAVLIGGNKLWIETVSLVFGLVVLYAFGTVWYIKIYTARTGTIGLLTALSLCVFPFILPDLLKLCMALLLSRRIAKIKKKI